MSEAIVVQVGERVGEVSALLDLAPSATSLLVFAHGAGAGMRHAFMQAAVERLGERGVGSLRYQFPYMEKGARRPDPPGVLLATVRAACEVAAARTDLPLFAGGKSMGGRMSSQAAVDGGLPDIRGLVFLGFPLHPAGRPSATRGEHLDRVDQPMLFVQGTRDSLADLEMLRPVCERLGPRADLHVIEGGDHSFHGKKSSGRTDDEVLDEVADRVAEWMRGVRT